jgi:hypothetical protein
MTDWIDMDLRRVMELKGSPPISASILPSALYSYTVSCRLGYPRKLNAYFSVFPGMGFQTPEPCPPPHAEAVVS